MSAALLSIEPALHWLTPIFVALKIYLPPVGSGNVRHLKPTAPKLRKK